MAEKVTVMLLKVDLQCPCCYKKVKKILCKFPQITEQKYNEKTNTVTITVVCCSPEKIRDKLCCKGAGVIISIEIIPEKKPPSIEKKPPSIEKKPPSIEKKTPPPSPSKSPPPPTCTSPPPGRTCCRPCSEGYGGGPCYHGCGVPRPPPPCHDWWPCHVSKCECYIIEERPPACSAM